MKIIFGGILILVFLAACSKQDSYQAEGTLTGVDFTLCACCGGVMLTIDNRSGNYRIDSLPFMTRQQLYNTDFPKRIKFNYQVAGGCTSIEHLEVSEYVMY